MWASCWCLPPVTLRGLELFCVCLCVGFTLPTVRCPVTCGPLTADGAMYEWGTLWERAIVSPQRIHLPSPSPSDQKRVVQIACGRKHALALDGELAHVSQRACPEFRMSYPCVVPMLYASLSVGGAETGMVYSWGYGALGRLGHGTTDSFFKPKLIASLAAVTRKGDRVMAIGCGGAHSGCITSVCGRGRSGLERVGPCDSKLTKQWCVVSPARFRA